MGGGTYSEISDMLDAHYNGRINISDYWSIGDTRTETISEIMISGDSVATQPSQEIELCIIGLNHDDLETEINGHSKAAITIQTLNCLSYGMGMDGGSGGNYPYACWSTTYASTNSTLYPYCRGRDFCNNEFINALPIELIPMIKSIIKLSNRHDSYSKSGQYSLHETTVDSVFLISASELWGDELSTKLAKITEDDDGVQYTYYKTASNRVKNTVVAMQACHWWLRTSYIDSDRNSGFIAVDDTGNRTYIFNATYGIAPAFCL